jgi:N-acetylneuraminic acid mutarotase
MAYDESSDRVILYGGSGRSDTWAYDLPTDTWKDLNPTTKPPGRNYAAMVYDPKGERMVLFGGTVGPWLQETALGDIWTYSYKTNTWTEVPTTGGPSARGWHGMAYDEATAKIVLFGGGKDRRSFLSDTWIFDPQTNSWSSIP